MESLILENFRCFAGRHEVPLRPLTLLVGENSSGKTNFLAAARIAELLPRKFVPGPDFNEEPFVLGAFEELVNYRSGKAGRADSFGLGSSFLREFGRETILIRFLVEFTKHSGHPTVKRLIISHENYEIDVNFFAINSAIIVKTPTKNEGIPLLEEIGNGEKKATGQPRPAEVWRKFAMMGLDLTRNFRTSVKLPYAEKKILAEMAKSISRELVELFPNKLPLPPYASAPIRAQPRRTYEPLSDLPRPQGDHVPMLLAQIYGQKEWEQLRGPLEKFAGAAGLFDQIMVKRLGKSESSPFQIHVKLGGPSRNIMDVGYGVSQALPLLVDLLRDKRPRLYLVQQPEVHLHPRAQAELGTLFATIAKNRAKQLLIETHSDYIVDRVRMEVRDKTIKPADVIILYFERVRGEVQIHPIEMDEYGNLIDPPASYGSFFLREEARFLGVADVYHS